MLTPVTPNPLANATTIKSHGSETRTAAGQNAIESQNQPQTFHFAHGIGLDAGSILSNVNAEAATAGNHTILQTLALAVAAQLNLTRRSDEAMDAFFLRIAAALDDMSPDERSAIELRAGLKMLKIQLPELSAALKQPDSALAARLSAAAESPLATPQKTAAATATTSYLQEAPGVSRAAETLAMVTQARTNTDGNGLFSSTPKLLPQENQANDARSLQSQLKSLFEPGVAETRIEIATKVEQPKTLLLGGNVDLPEAKASTSADGGQAAAPDTIATAEQPGAGEGSERVDQPDAAPARAKQGTTDLRETARNIVEMKTPDAKLPEARPPATGLVRQADTAHAGSKQPDTGTVVAKNADFESWLAGGSKPEQAEARTEPRMQGLLIPQNNNNPSASMRVRALARELVQDKFQNAPDVVNRRAGGEDSGDHRMQTMLTLKGIAEVITSMPAKAAEFMLSSQLVADIQAKELKNNLAAAAATDGNVPVEAEALKSVIVAHKDGTVTAHHMPPSSLQAEDEVEESPGTAERTPIGQPQSVAASETEKATALLKGAAAGLDPVPFAYAALQPPAKEKFEADAFEEHGRQDDEDENAEEQEQEDAEARRERLARKATDDLLRPEPEADPELKITRDSSQADRAYALYQRMAGF